MKNFKDKLKKVAKDTDLYLKSFLKRQKSNSFLLKPMKYGIFSGSKKIRSKVIVDTGKIFGINYKVLIAISAAVECIHSYSLIHDDLPCMDDDSHRRGKPSTYKKFGESTAILAGNSLLTLAFEILSDKKLKLKDKIKSKLINFLSICSGHSGVAGGQYLDLDFEHKKVAKRKIIGMQIKKTGQLFGFCCASSGIIKDKKNIAVQDLAKIGADIGLLFQMTDDLIDVKGNSKKAGKATKKDKKKGKATLIKYLGYKKSLIFLNILNNKITNKLKKYGSRSKDLIECVSYITNREF